jgi:hypothetical protein
LLYSSLPIFRDFKTVRFYDIQKFFVRNSDQAYNQPIDLDKMSKYFLLKPLYKDKYEEILKLNDEKIDVIIEKIDFKHDPFIDANITLKLFFLIPEKMIDFCRINFDDFLKVIQNYNKSLTRY